MNRLLLESGSLLTSTQDSRCLTTWRNFSITINLLFLKIASFHMQVLRSRSMSFGKAQPHAHQKACPVKGWEDNTLSNHESCCVQLQCCWFGFVFMQLWLTWNLLFRPGQPGARKDLGSLASCVTIGGSITIVLRALHVLLLDKCTTPLYELMLLSLGSVFCFSRQHLV